MPDCQHERQDAVRAPVGLVDPVDCGLGADYQLLAARLVARSRDVY